MFAENFAKALNAAAFRDQQRSMATGFHIAAFETRDTVTVPVFHFVTNIESMDGPYYSRLGAFKAEEQLLSRDYRGVAPADIRAALRIFAWQNGQPLWYRNGDVPFHGPITGHLMQAMSEVVQNDRARRRDEYQLPNSLAGWSTYVTALVDTSIALAALLFNRGSAGDEHQVTDTDRDAGGSGPGRGDGAAL